MDVFRAEAVAKKNFINARTLDGFDNFVSRLGLNNDNTLSAGTYEFNYITRNRIKLEAAYRGSWIAGKVCDVYAQDMTRAGVSVSTNESEEDIKDFQAGLSRLQVMNSVCTGITWGRLYGGAIGVLQIAGQNLETPLVPETVSKGQFKGLAVYDRWQLNPVVNDPILEGPELGLPKIYQIVSGVGSIIPPGQEGKRQDGMVNVHHSRVVRFTGIQLPFYQAIMEMMWGESVLERLWDRLISFDNASLSSAQLIDRANLRTVGIDGFREIIAAGGEAQAGLEQMFEMMRAFQVNEGLTLLDKNDDFSSTSYSFAGLSDMLLQFGQQLSGACDIPLVRLFGQSPAGLSATGEADLRMYYDSINAQQEARLRVPFDVLLKVCWQSLFGKPTPKDFEFKFTPLWQTSALDKATIAKTNTDTVVEAFDAGLLSKPAAVKDLRGLSTETGLFSNISDEDVAEAEAEPPPAPDEELPGEEEKGKPFGEAKAADQKLSRWRKWFGART